MRPQSWALSQGALEGLLSRLAGDVESAGRAYERIRLKLVKVFEYRGCPAPEDAADETIDRVARKLAQGEDIRAADPYVYFHGVALNVLRERWARPEGRWLSLDELPPHAQPVQSAVQADGDEDRRSACLDRCLARLEPRQRQIILAYYEWDRKERIGQRHELARRLGMVPNTLRVQAHRLRTGLEACVRACSGAGSPRAEEPRDDQD